MARERHPEAREPEGEVPEGGGDCYESAVSYLEQNCGDPNMRLVHAVCLLGVGPHKGAPYGHAWCESGPTPEPELIAQIQAVFPEADVASVIASLPRLCIDQSNQRDIRMLHPLYYQAGRVTQVHRYTIQEARAKMLEHKHFGPWDLEVDR